MIFKAGGKEYQVKFAYEPTLKSRILSKLAKIEAGANGEGSGADEISNIENLLLIIPELLLVGLQKFHREEFGYSYDTGEGKEEQLSKVYELIDNYLDEDEDSGTDGLYFALQDEMLKNGFLAKMFRKEKDKAEQNEAAKKSQTIKS